MTSPLANLTNARILRFGAFEVDIEGERLLKNGVTVRLQPQPFKLLCLLASQSGRLVTRDDIRSALWPSDTFVDFEQGVNFAIKQVRDALGENAEHANYIQTVPKRGYRFVAPVEAVARVGEPEQATPARADLALQKLLWIHIADLRLAEARRRKRMRAAGIAAAVLVLAGLIGMLFYR